MAVLPERRRLLVGMGSFLDMFEAAKRGVRLALGVSILTSAYALPAKGIMHTIVPKWNKNKPRQSYGDPCVSYASVPPLADEGGFESIAFPVLASGNNGVDPDLAIGIAIQPLTQCQPKNRLSEAHLATFGDS